jgi:peptidoglycan hydrolase CwlO-like protein
MGKSLTPEQVVYLMGIITFIMSACAFYIGRKKENADEVKQSVEHNTKINWKLDQLCDDSRSLRVDVQTQYKSIEGKLDKINEEVIVLKRDQKTSFNLHDENKANIHRLEEEINVLKNRIITLETINNQKEGH